MSCPEATFHTSVTAVLIFVITPAQNIITAVQIYNYIWAKIKVFWHTIYFPSVIRVLIINGIGVVGSGRRK